MTIEILSSRLSPPAGPQNPAEPSRPPARPLAWPLAWLLAWPLAWPLAWLVSGAAIAAPTDLPDLPRSLPLRQAVAIAIQQNPNLLVALAQLDQAEARERVARSLLLPQVSLTGSQSYQTTNLRAQGLDMPFMPSKLGPFGSLDFRMLASQDVLNVSSRRNREASHARAESSREQMMNARETLTLTVVSAYLQALKNRASCSTITQQTALAQQLFDLTRDRRDKGIASTLDVNRAQQQVNTFRQSQLDADGQLAVSKLQIANILHARIADRFDLVELESSRGAPAGNGEEMVRIALESRPDYRAASNQVRAVEAQLKSVRATRLPVVQVRGDFGQSGCTPAENISTYRVLGAVNLPVFTGGKIDGQVAESQAQLREARAQIEQLRSQIETEVRGALVMVEAAGREVAFATQNVGLAREEVDLAVVRMTSGLGDNTEIVNAQDRLSRAEDNRIRTIYGLQLYRANLQRAMGRVEHVYGK